MSKTRRQFLEILSALGAAALSGKCLLSPSWAADAGSTKAKVLPFSGDDFTRGHRLRNGDIPKFPDKPDRKADFVIVGGGMAGLITAFFLKDRDFLLLEQYEHSGGTSSGSSYRGIDYSRGAVCTGKPNELKEKLFEDLAIKPAVISNEQTAWHCGGQWLKTINGSDEFHRQFKRLKEEATTNLAKQPPSLSETTFSKYLSGYSKPFLGLIDNISYSFFGAGCDYVSADAGCFMINALTEDSYVFDGGNSGIARAIRGALGKAENADSKRLLTDSFVWSVQPHGNGASVYYSDGDHSTHRIDCRHVVVCVPPLVASRIISGLPDSVRIAWQEIEYSAFVVANFLMRKKAIDFPYQSFADQPYPFCQMVMAEAPYQATGRYRPDMGSVLTVYHPFKGLSAGRARLITLDREEFGVSMVDQLSQLFEPFQSNLEAIDICRWGHAITVPKPGLAQALNQIDPFQCAWFTYAHSTAGGGQSLEGAITAARRAADRCLKIC